MATRTSDNLVAGLDCDVEDWVRRAETSAEEFSSRKEKLAPFRDAGWYDNGPTFLSYFKRFRSSSGTEYQTEVWLDDDGFLRWGSRGGPMDLGTQKVELDDAEKIIRFVEDLEKRVTANE